LSKQYNYENGHVYPLDLCFMDAQYIERCNQSYFINSLAIYSTFKPIIKNKEMNKDEQK